LYSLAVSSPAKVNLFLEVVRKRPDGYHDIESVFHTVDLQDRLCFTRREDDKLLLYCDADNVPTDGSNLILQAAEALRRASGCNLGVEIALQKRIPPAAGLGGGSSNAAASLQALSTLWDLDLPLETLAPIAADLGADVPFFLHGGTCFCTGRGEAVEPLAAPPAMDFVLVFPQWTVATPEAYAALDEAQLGTHSSNAFVRAFNHGDMAGMTREMFNRFEDTVFRMEPRQEKLQRALSDLGFRAVRMTGSGSTVFGLVPEDGDPKALAREAGRCDGVRAVETARSCDTSGD